MEDNLSVMNLWEFIGNLSIDKLSVNITIYQQSKGPREKLEFGK